MSPIKEPCYFAMELFVDRFTPEDRARHREKYREFISGEMSKTMHIAQVDAYEDYLALFRKVRSETAIGEASVAYLYSSHAAEEIRKRIPHAKIVIMLRNPADRAFSQYLMDLQTGRVTGSFAKELRAGLKRSEKSWGSTRMYLEPGLYFEQVKRYLQAFGRERVWIGLTEDLRRNRDALMRDLYNFIEVEPAILPPDELSLNVGRGIRFPRLNYWLHRWRIKRSSSYTSATTMRGSRLSRILYKPVPKLSARDRAMLMDFFVADIRKLQDLIGCDLSAWLR